MKPSSAPIRNRRLSEDAVGGGAEAQADAKWNLATGSWNLTFSPLKPGTP